MIVAIYNSSTKIQRVISCPVWMVADQCGPDEEFYLNPPIGATHVIDGVAVTEQIEPPWLFINK